MQIYLSQIETESDPASLDSSLPVVSFAHCLVVCGTEGGHKGLTRARQLLYHQGMSPARFPKLFWKQALIKLPKLTLNL